MAARKRKKGGRKKKSSRGRKRTSTRRSSSRKKKVGRKKGGRRKGGRKKGSRRKYSRSASSDVEKEMHEYKRGKAHSGRSGRKVKSRKQAIAIGLSKARRKGKRVPKKRGR
jgi:hypothetical protein